TLQWSDASVQGAFRFLRNLWRLAADHLAAGPVEALAPASLDEAQRALRRKVHETIVKVNDDIGRRYKFNTAVAAVMELINALSAAPSDSPAWRAVVREGIETAILLLSPIVPHITDHIWREFGHEGLIMDAPWPEADPVALKKQEVQLVVQVNGKLRAHITVPAEADQEEIRKAALASEDARRFIGGKDIKRVVVVPNRL